MTMGLRHRAFKSLCRSEVDSKTAKKFIIYRIVHYASGRTYVGLSKRSLGARVAGHVYQSRRERRVHPEGLLQAFREVEAFGGVLDEVFQATKIDEAETAAEAKALEAVWIARLHAAHPVGYNRMPGGSSVGGPSNSLPVTVDFGNGLQTEWPSIDAVINRCNINRATAGQRPLRASTFYARLSAGWTIEETCELVPRLDGRALKRVIHVGDETCTTLSEASALTGIGVGALRSRLHRRQGNAADLVQDRRTRFRIRNPRILVIWPPTGERLTLSAFAALTGVKLGTLLNRWHRAHNGAVDVTDANALSTWLQTQHDRRKCLTLSVPKEIRWQGGYRELARAVVANGNWNGRRPFLLGESGILRRLRCLTEAELKDNRKLLWAFGFE